MRASPRRLRQDKITLFFHDESEFDIAYKAVHVDYVRIDENYGINQSAKGIESDSQINVIIDLNDLQTSPLTPIDKFIEYLIKGKTLVKLEHTVDVSKAFTLNAIKKDKGASNMPSFLELLLK